MTPDRADLRAGSFFLTFSAGFETLGHRALPNFAQRAAKQGFGTIHPTSFAVDMFRKDGCLVQLGPAFGGLFPKDLVVILRSDVGVAMLAIQPTDGNQSFH